MVELQFEVPAEEIDALFQLAEHARAEEHPGGVSVVEDPVGVDFAAQAPGTTTIFGRVSEHAALAAVGNVGVLKR